MKKNVLYFIVVITAIIAVMSVISGCKKDGAVKIALMMRTLDEQFLIDYAANVEKLAAEKGVKLSVQDARRDAQTQINQVQTLLKQGYRHFVIVPVDTALSDHINRMIHEKGGAAAYSNTQPTTSSLKIGPNFFFVSSPEVSGGRIQGQLIADYFGKNPEKAPGRVLNIIQLNGQMGHPAQVNRRSGLLAELSDRGYTINIIAEGTASDWGPDQAGKLMNDWIESYRGQFNAVAAQNDGMALGAIQAMIQNGLVKDDTQDGTRLAVPVFGIDATGDAIASMRRYELYATVLQDAAGQSAAAFDVIYQVATGAYSPGNIAGGTAAATAIVESPANDLSIITQCYLVPFVAVDRESEFFMSY